MADILLEKNSSGYYDINFTDEGDFVTTEGFETAILMSLLGEKRANESEVVEPQFRRGDWSNELNDVPDYEVGSKLWLLYVARANTESMNSGIDSIKDGLQWMIDDNLIKDANAEGTISYRGITFKALVTQENNKVDKYLVDDFIATGT